MSWNQWSSGLAYKEFMKNAQAQTQEEEAAQEAEIAAYQQRLQEGEPDAVDPFLAEDYEPETDVSVDENGVFAFLRIPALEIEKPIYLGASARNLAKGVAQIDGTSLPVGGVGTRSVIAGHRGWYNDVMFLHLEELETGDRIYIDRKGETLTYSVTTEEVIRPAQWETLMPVEGKDILTLLTCHPRRAPRPLRLLVHAERVLDTPVVSDEAGNVSVVDRAPNRIVTWTTYGVYIVTALGWALLLFVLWRFAKYLRG
ncbi:class C sortase [Peptoniphilus sp. KCTC 25270]|nr:class C sortase [Peptoniphilus sp. KCTC 25270]